MRGITKIISKTSIALFSLGFALFFMQSSLFAETNANHTEQIPTTIPAIWQAIDEHAALINQAIADNQLEKIHQHAFAIRDLVQALPALSNDLPEDKLTAVKRNIGYVEQLATRLDKTGDANDKEGTLANWQKLQKMLALIRANYSDVLSSSANKS